MEKSTYRMANELAASMFRLLRSRQVFEVSAACVLLCTGVAFAQDPDEADVSAAELDGIVQDIRESSQYAKEALRSLDSDRLDTAVVLELADFTVEKIVEWVSENTRWIPYHGVLRGAAGVLADRRGNSLDRSLLLATLLEEAGYDTRLARTSLPLPFAEEILRRQLARSAHPEKKPILSDLGQKHLSDALEQAAALKELAGLESATRNWSDSVDAAADHWWVQMQKDGQWIEIDPLFEGLDANLRPSAVFMTRPENLPEQLFHRVAVRIIVERWNSGELVEEVPLELVVNASKDIAQELSVGFMPYGADIAENAEWMEIHASLIRESRSWLPFIRLAGKPYTDMGFGLNGQLEMSPEKPAIQRKADLAVSALGGLSGNTQEGKSTSILVAVWIEYEVLVPGSKGEIIRREVFDLIGADRRRNKSLSTLAVDESSMYERGAALLGSSQILVVNSKPPLDLLDRAILEFWANSGHLVAGLVRIAHDGSAQEPQKRLANGSVFPLDLLELAVYRHVLSPDDSSVSLDRPNVFGNHYYLLDESGTFARATDIVSNRIAVAPGVLDAHAIRLRQGVLDTVLEAALVPDSGPMHNTAVLFSETRELITWEAQSTAGTSSSRLPATVRARIADAVDAGRIVVAPNHVADGREPAWWKVDPADGTTLGIGYRGWGAVIAGDPRVLVIPTLVKAKGAAITGKKLCTGVAVATTAIQLLAPSADPRVRWTLPSMKAQAKPLLRRHCLVSASWSPS